MTFESPDANTDRSTTKIWCIGTKNDQLHCTRVYWLVDQNDQFKTYQIPGCLKILAIPRIGILGNSWTPDKTPAFTPVFEATKPWLPVPKARL